MTTKRTGCTLCGDGAVDSGLCAVCEDGLTDDVERCTRCGCTYCMCGLPVTEKYIAEKTAREMTA